MFNYSFTAKSSNKKTGAMPVTRTDKRSCPSCPLKNNGCYASQGPSAIHWNKLNNSGLSLVELSNKIKDLPDDTLWRHNEAGDLPGMDDKIDIKQLQVLVESNKNKKGYTYTHYPLTDHNINAIDKANKEGFTINVSLNSLSEVKAAVDVNVPKTVLVAEDAPNKSVIGSETILVCPAQIKDSMTCSKCKLCQKSDRKFIIGFRVHGSQKKKALTVTKA